MKVFFQESRSKAIVTEDFEAENIHAEDMQVAGWQVILNRSKLYQDNNK